MMILKWCRQSLYDEWKSHFCHLKKKKKKLMAAKKKKDIKLTTNCDPQLDVTRSSKKNKKLCMRQNLSVLWTFGQSNWHWLVGPFRLHFYERRRDEFPSLGQLDGWKLFRWNGWKWAKKFTFIFSTNSTFFTLECHSCFYLLLLPWINTSTVQKDSYIANSTMQCIK